jgi:hypothetical protein
MAEGAESVFVELWIPYMSQAGTAEREGGVSLSPINQNRKQQRSKMGFMLTVSQRAAEELGRAERKFRSSLLPPRQ